MKINWSQLIACRGHSDPTKIPIAIENIFSRDKETRKKAYWKLDNHIVVQGDLNSSAPYATRLIVDKLHSQELVSLELVTLLIELYLACGQDLLVAGDLSGRPMDELCKEIIFESKPYLISERTNLENEVIQEVDYLINLMNFVKPKTQHLKKIMTWIPNETQLLQWAGPDFRYPYDLESFSEDLKLEKLQSYCLLSDDSQLLAFGQFYKRLGRCHLGRLIVNPDHRGKGVIYDLIEKLCDYGCAELGVKDCSLFVLDNNQAALKAYKNCGFQRAEYPKKLQLENCLYMIKNN